MRLSARASQPRLRLQSINNHHFYPQTPPSPLLHDWPTRLFTTHPPPHRAPIGRIYPIPAASHRRSAVDPAANLPDMFDIPTEDRPARTSWQRLVLSLRRSGRVVFAVCVAGVGLAALGTIGYELLLDPGHAAHSASFQFVQHHPTAVALLGGRLIELSDHMRGQQCHDSVRQVGDEQWAQCVYRVRGDSPQGGEGEVTAVLKRGKRGGWLVVHVTLDAWLADGRRKRVVVCDYRKQMQSQQQTATMAAVQ